MGTGCRTADAAGVCVGGGGGVAIVRASSVVVVVVPPAVIQRTALGVPSQR